MTNESSAPAPSRPGLPPPHAAMRVMLAAFGLAKRQVAMTCGDCAAYRRTAGGGATCKLSAHGRTETAWSADWQACGRFESAPAPIAKGGRR